MVDNDPNGDGNVGAAMLSLLCMALLSCALVTRSSGDITRELDVFGVDDAIANDIVDFGVATLLLFAIGN